MKKFFFLIVALFMINFSFAQNKVAVENNAYTEMMKNTLNKLSEAKSQAAYVSVRNMFLRVAKVDSTQWLPYYYAAYAGLLESYFMKGDAVDNMLNDVDNYLEKATSVNPRNEEIYILRSWAASARISVNPMTRGKKYGMEADNYLNRAAALNQNNPRIYFMKAQMALYTPEQFGGGRKEAIKNFTQAQKLFSSFTLENILMPNWGKEETDKQIQELQKGEDDIKK